MNQAEEIINGLKKLVKSEPLWTAKDIADYLNMSQSSFKRRIMKIDDFPVSISIPYATGGRSSRRWHPEEVRRWVLKHRLKN